MLLVAKCMDHTEPFCCCSVRSWNEEGLKLRISDASRGTQPIDNIPGCSQVSEAAARWCCNCPVISGPVTSGPVTSRPVISGPVISGPVTSGPVTSGPGPAWPSGSPASAGAGAAAGAAGPSHRRR